MHPHHRLPAPRLLRAVAMLVCIASLVPSIGRPADARPGGIVTVNGFALSVQPPGRGVFVMAIRLDGSVRTAGVQTRADGTVLVGGRGSFAGPPSSGTVSPSACTDSAFSLYPTSWVTTYNWYFNTGSTPSGISQSSATGALKAAANNITKANNDCGLPDLVSAKNAYKGSTTLNPNISNGSSCLNSDGESVVGFGTLSSIYVGFTCWWTIGNDTVEADVKLNKADYTWYVTKPAGCSNKWDIQAVATHEFGHAFGLLDLAEATHANLTMSTVINACQNAEDTLGLGDVLGLEAKY
jgi:hypothetical protein